MTQPDLVVEMEIKEEAQSKSILHWNYRGFAELPTELETDGSNVREIYLKHNNITTLPPWIQDLRNLSALYLDNNNISELPQEIGLLTKLTDLNLSSNCLSQLPSEIKSLHRLSTLIIKENYLTTLPADLEKLTSLRKLDISCNGIRAIPHSIGKIRTLEELNVDGNPIFELPTNIFSLPNLTDLSANCCDLRCLPAIVLTARPFPQITFKINPALKHIPLTLEPIFESNANITTGFWTYDATQVTHPSQIHVSVHTHGKMPKSDIYFYSGLEHISHSKKMEIPSLLELALRQTYDSYCTSRHKPDQKTNLSSRIREEYLKICSVNSETPSCSNRQPHDFNNNIDEQLFLTEMDLPRCISAVLENGPNATCQQCKKGVFKYAVLKLIHRDLKRTFGENTLLCSALFCNSHCCLQWERAHESTLKHHDILWSMEEDGEFCI